MATKYLAWFALSEQSLSVNRVAYMILGDRKELQVRTKVKLNPEMFKNF